MIKMKQPLRVLLIEDSEDDAELLIAELQQGGYEPTYERVDTAVAMTEALNGQSWDIILSDFSMPSFSAPAALDLLTQTGLDIPFIIVSGAIGEATAVEAMKKGAHDYLLKGSLSRLLPAIDRELREAAVRSERKRADERLRYLAYHDSVTDLPNHSYLQEHLGRAIVTAKHAHNRLALIIMKVNRFNEVNETLGHEMADLVLKEIGQRVKNNLRKSDIVACLRGDEFAVLLTSPEDVERSTDCVCGIIETLEQPFVLSGFKLGIHVSFGLTYFPEHGTTADTLIQRARIALTAAAQNHSDYTIYSAEQEQNTLQQLSLLGDLRRAIVEDQLFLLYQPKIDLREGYLTGVEALIRWRHPSLGIIPPDQFIPLAERTGFIMPVTLWVIHEALAQCATWRAENLQVRIAVNLSTWNLQANEIAEQITGLIGSSGICPDQLQLEVTESAIMANPDQTLKNVTRMKNMGLRFSIDDFGTGYSSLAYLKQLPVDEIKIDKSFVMKMTTDQGDAVIVRSTIDLAHNLGLKVVAEGVENQETLRALVALGCDEAQGYYFSKPLQSAELIEWQKQRVWPSKTEVSEIRLAEL
jgi:diguanylate cyclase (GGDEF)-like protein